MIKYILVAGDLRHCRWIGHHNCVTYPLAIQTIKAFLFLLIKTLAWFCINTLLKTLYWPDDSSSTLDFSFTGYSLACNLSSHNYFSNVVIFWVQQDSHFKLSSLLTVPICSNLNRFADERTHISTLHYQQQLLTGVRSQADIGNHDTPFTFIIRNH